MYFLINYFCQNNQMKDIDPIIFQNMVNDGYTEKMIHHYFSYINPEKEENFPKGYMEWAHEHGFIASHAYALGVNDKNYNEFISDYDFYKTWPHNSWLRLWINDKMSLKYLLNGTEWGKYMPEYYYYTLGNKLRCLVDNPYRNQSIDTFMRLLREKSAFACKPNNGTESSGFHKMSYDDKCKEYYFDNTAVSPEYLEDFVLSNPNYIYTEYLEPGYGLELVHSKIHTLRVIVINEDGLSPIIVGGYLRFPVDQLGEANFARALENKEDFFFYLKVNMVTGELLDPMALYCDHVESMSVHPDSGFDFSKGCKIALWDEVLRVSKGISCFFFGNQFIGYDFGITNKGLKIMEINGLPGNMGDQWSRDVYDNKPFVDFIRKRLSDIDNLPIEERVKRRYIK